MRPSLFRAEIEAMQHAVAAVPHPAIDLRHDFPATVARIRAGTPSTGEHLLQAVLVETAKHAFAHGVEQGRTEGVQAAIAAMSVRGRAGASHDER
jgi:hypothetical protein